jgi:hypothetical protein
MELNDHSMISISEDVYNVESMTSQPRKTQWTRRELILLGPTLVVFSWSRND